MESTTLDSELIWRAEGSDARIGYAQAVIEELAIAATEGFNRLPHGGVEIGGVLFGVRGHEGTKIFAQRALECEHALGPSFTLSDHDRAAFEELLDAPARDDELAGLQAVGWYLSHNRSGLALAPKDVQLFDSYFPERGQVTLVMRPNRLDPVRACFFPRDVDGSVNAADTAGEFVIQPRPVVLRSSVEPARAEPPAAEPDPAAEPEESPTQDARKPPLLAPLFPAQEPQEPQQRRRRYWTAAAAAAVAGVAAGALFWAANGRASADITLRALDVGGQLQIEWTCPARIALLSDGASLEIEDGSQKVLTELSVEQLRAGSLTYSRSSGNVLARLTVRGANRGPLTQMVRFLGAPVAIAPAPVALSNSPGFAERALLPPPERKTLVRPEKVDNPKPRLTTALIPTSTPTPPTPAPIATSTPAAPRHELVLPATAVPAAPDPLVPPPPSIAASSAPSIEAPIPRLPAPVPSAPPPPVKRAIPGPTAGKLIWTGRLVRGGTVQIFGDRASSGHVTGALPGEPIRVRIFPAEMTQDGLRLFTSDPKAVGVPEAPGAQNGWNPTVYVLNPRQADDVRVVEAPGQQNGWKRISLRADRADHAIIVLRWERIGTAQ